MSRMFTQRRLHQENLAFAGTGGVSQNNRHAAFQAAFRDEVTGRVELARFESGAPAPMHLLAGLPGEWVVERDSDGHAIAVLDSIVAGFVRGAEFFTREEAAACA